MNFREREREREIEIERERERGRERETDRETDRQTDAISSLPCFVLIFIQNSKSPLSNPNKKRRDEWHQF